MESYCCLGQEIQLYPKIPVIPKTQSDYRRKKLKKTKIEPKRDKMELCQ
jgi:hypothetical protein